MISVGTVVTHEREREMNVQSIIDRFLMESNLSSVVDMEYIKSEGYISVRRRRLGQRPVLIDISRSNTEESLLKRLKAHPAVY